MCISVFRMFFFMGFSNSYPSILSLVLETVDPPLACLHWSLLAKHG